MIQFLITSLHNNNSKSLASVQRVDRAHFIKPLVHYFTVCDPVHYLLHSIRTLLQRRNY